MCARLWAAFLSKAAPEMVSGYKRASGSEVSCIQRDCCVICRNGTMKPVSSLRVTRFSAAPSSDTLRPGQFLVFGVLCVLLCRGVLLHFKADFSSFAPCLCLSATRSAILHNVNNIKEAMFSTCTYLKLSFWFWDLCSISWHKLTEQDRNKYHSKRGGHSSVTILFTQMEICGARIS